jgi:hypothetical protein
LRGNINFWKNEREIFLRFHLDNPNQLETACEIDFSAQAFCSSFSLASDAASGILNGSS